MQWHTEEKKANEDPVQPSPPPKKNYFVYLRKPLFFNLFLPTVLCASIVLSIVREFRLRNNTMYFFNTVLYFLTLLAPSVKL